MPSILYLMPRPLEPRNVLGGIARFFLVVSLRIDFVMIVDLITDETPIADTIKWAAVDAGVSEGLICVVWFLAPWSCRRLVRHPETADDWCAFEYDPFSRRAAESR